MKNMYSPLELKKITEKAEKHRQKFPYSESDLKETLEDLQIGGDVVNYVMNKYGKKEKIKKPKIERPRKKGLENQIIKEDLKRIGNLVVRGVSASFILPTALRQYSEDEEDTCTQACISNLLGWACIYSASAGAYPPLAAGLFLTHLITNVGSFIYEYLRDVKERAKEKN